MDTPRVKGVNMGMGKEPHSKEGDEVMQSKSQRVLDRLLLGDYI
jgi:hypothetical protein